MTTNNATENPCTCIAGTDVKCPSCLTGEMEDLRNDVESMRKDIDDVDFDELQTERDVERSIEEALEQFGRDNEFLSEDDVERLVERGINDALLEDCFADAQAFSNLGDDVEELKTQLQAMQTMLETLHARTLRARYARFVSSLRGLRVRVLHVLHVR